ncbi:trinucleotide repeat-containing gene 6B protein-like isoform X1 [Polyodon spathula]|uniref:trinucleotide repeat-containing gene 6B protein-like isoform X1 n=1 Tax=Polyodon spathula TaxID=7913 RepID=UPI001B7EE338|nr:trinucleotide repeat-containing gene 6B protein-like isoform X1 [Polyodon spathula]
MLEFGFSLFVNTDVADSTSVRIRTGVSFRQCGSRVPKYCSTEWPPRGRGEGEGEAARRSERETQGEKEKLQVPVSAKLSPSPPHPANPSVTPPIPTVSSSGNGKRAPPSAQQQPPAAPRFPPREVPPRFRQQEHKQVLKRGQPLPAGTLITTGQPGASSPLQTPPASPSKQHAGEDKAACASVSALLYRL